MIGIRNALATAAFVVALWALWAVAVALPAEAAERHGLVRLHPEAIASHPPNCWGPLCHWPTPEPPPGKIPDVTDTRTILTMATDNQAGLVKFLKDEDAEAGAIIPGSNPPAVFDPIAHMCLAGIPSATPPVMGLIAFFEGFQGPSALPPANTDLPIDPEHIRLEAANIENTIQGILTNGWPTDIKQSCGSLINDEATQVASIAGSALTLNALLLQILPILAVK